MPEISLVRLADQYLDASKQEEVLPWLVALDYDQNGSLDAKEISDDKGLLRCDGWTQKMSRGTWRNLESMLNEAGLVKGERNPSCGKTGKLDKFLPIAPQGRFPAPYQVQFFALDYDWVFTLQQGVSAKVLLQTLTPQAAKVTQGKTQIDVEFNSGRSARIELGKSGGVQKIHYFGSDGKYSLLARLEFLQIFRDAGVFEKTFAPNPYYEEEQDAGLRLYSPVFTYKKVPTLTLEAANKACWKGILLVPDLHGNSSRYRAMVHFLREETLDWFALEMLPHNLQQEADDFISEPEDSKKFLEAKRKLQNHLQPFWAAYYKEFKDPDENPYYRLLLLAKKRGIRVVGIDSRASYTSASQKMTPLAIATRNKIWSEYIPEEGRGIVYGGQAHFTWNPKARVQDFLWEKTTDRTITLVTFDEKEKRAVASQD